MKLFGAFLIGLLLNTLFLFAFSSLLTPQKDWHRRALPKKNNPKKVAIKVHFKEVLPKLKTQKTLEKPVPSKPDPPKKKLFKKDQRKVKKGEKRKEKSKKEKKDSLFTPSMTSKIKGLLKGKIPYPYRARLKNMEGDVSYTLTLSPSGETQLYLMTHSSGHELLDQTVREFFLQNPLKGKVTFKTSRQKFMTIKDQVQFRINRL